MTSYNKIAKTDLADNALYEKINDMVDALNADKIELTQIGTRRASAVYKIADRCFCEYHGDLLLECTTAGTTAVGQLDTSGSLNDGDVITDGSVQWTVRAVATKDELNSVFPPQGGNAGKALVTDGENVKWEDVDAFPPQGGNAGKALVTDGENAYWANVSDFDLFDHKWSDHILNDMSWLRADTFSWQNGELYKSAYEHLVGDLGEEIQTTLHCWEYGATRFYTKSETPSVGDAVFYSDGSIRTYKVEGIIDSTTIIIDGERSVRNAYYDTTIIEYSNAEKIYDQSFHTFITYYQAEDGHKIVLADQEANVQAIYEETGVAWYYILDVANKRFKLPRTKYGFVGLRDGVGDYIAETLPNIRYTTEDRVFGNGTVSNGALTVTVSGNTVAYNSAGPYKGGTLSFNAGDSSSAYQDNAPVQQRATQMYLYFYVGNYTKSAIEQTAGLNSELFNGKMDRDMSNMNASQTAKETIVGWGMPDYSTGVTVNYPYTATYKGIAYISVDSGSDAIQVNGIVIGAILGGGPSSVCVFLDVGDTLTVIGDTVAYIKYYKLKGVNNA